MIQAPQGSPFRIDSAMQRNYKGIDADPGTFNPLVAGSEICKLVVA
jgi:hypothetical protein